MTIPAEASAPFALQVFFDADVGSDVSANSKICTQEFAQQYCLAALEAQTLMDVEHVAQVEVSVQIVEREVMQELNWQYRQKTGATNILSFESGLPVMPLDDDLHVGGMLALGDLVLCADVIDNEACEQAKLPTAHWAHMLVHGTLHLCGYDHEDEQQASFMESLEIQILTKAGFADPYATSE